MLNYLQLVVPFHYRRGGRRSSNLGSIVQSFKQITVDGPASRSAATNIVHDFLKGVDNYDGPTALNNEVPTGAKVMSVYIMATFTNLVSVSSLLHFMIGCRRAGQTFPTGGAVGGSNSRNLIIHTAMVFLGHDQNNNYVFRIKIPRIYQRIREGDTFSLLYRADTVFASATQVIYKFYR